MGLSPESQAKIAAARIATGNYLPSDFLLPDWVKEFRPHQKIAVKAILDAYDDGADVVILDAPTGSGKTLIAEAVRQLLKTKALYICTTKQLQDQFCRDFDYAKVMKGRSNYPTARLPEEFPYVTAAECVAQGGECKWCGYKSSCPYEIAKFAAARAELAVLNTAYLLAEGNGNPNSPFSGAELIVADEADTLESQLMDYISVEISARTMDKYQWTPPKKVTVVESWKEWLDEYVPIISKTKAIVRSTKNHEATRIREQNHLVSLASRLSNIHRTIDNGNWVYTGRENHVAFKPTRVDGLGHEYLWSLGTKWLLMSASIISAHELVESLGYKGSWKAVHVPSTFPVENRRVVVGAAANMAKKKVDAEGSTELEKMAEGVGRVLNLHPTDRILVHTVSYRVADTLMDKLVFRHLDRELITYKDAWGRDNALEKYLATENAVLFAPSMDRGVDLVGDACRVQVIAKVPFPNLGDRQISTRLHSRSGQLWYSVQTVRTLVQMTGRAVRSDTDFAITYILDSQFKDRVMSSGRGLFPQWWMDALDFRTGRELFG